MGKRLETKGEEKEMNTILDLVEQIKTLCKYLWGWFLVILFIAIVAYLIFEYPVCLSVK